MRPSAAVHDALAELLEYPRDGHGERVRELAARIDAELPGAADRLVLLAGVADQGLGAAEEAFVRTFDVSAERALEVGWQVFGEQYARGAFLVRLRERMRETGVAETTELPDHLTQVLRLLGRVSAEEAALLVSMTVTPALDRVRKDLGEGNPYAGLLDVVAQALEVPAEPCAAGEVA